MNTIVITLKEMFGNPTLFIETTYREGTRIVIKHQDEPVMELTSLKTEPETPVPAVPPQRPAPRYSICPHTGLSVVRARPGAPRITSEQIEEWLRDFP